MKEERDAEAGLQMVPGDGGFVVVHPHPLGRYWRAVFPNRVVCSDCPEWTDVPPLEGDDA